MFLLSASSPSLGSARPTAAWVSSAYLSVCPMQVSGLEQTRLSFWVGFEAMGLLLVSSPRRADRCLFVCRRLGSVCPVGCLDCRIHFLLQATLDCQPMSSSVASEGPTLRF